MKTLKITVAIPQKSSLLEKLINQTEGYTQYEIRSATRWLSRIVENFGTSCHGEQNEQNNIVVVSE